MREYKASLEESIIMTMKVAKWTIDEYHGMINAGILRDRKVELVKGKFVERVSCATLAYSL